MMWTPVERLVDSHDQIVLALIAVVATAVAALVFVIRNSNNSRIAAEQSTAANAAVNGVGPEHRLWDKVDRIEQALQTLVQRQHDFDAHGWGSLPSDLDDAVSLTSTIRELQHNVGDVRSRLIDHDTWERSAKYDGD